MASASVSVRERVLLSAGRIRRVKAIDRAATLFIRLGGLFVIATVAFIFVFILGEALPLFRSASGTARGWLERQAPSDARPLLVGTDEYRLHHYELLADGRLVCYRSSDGVPVHTGTLSLPPGVTVTSASRSLLHDFVAAGTSDGRVALQQVRFRPRYENQKLAGLDIDVRARGTWTADAGGRPVRAVAYDEVDGRQTVAAVLGQDEVAVLRLGDDGNLRRDLLRTAGERITHVRLGRSDTLVAAGERGRLHHFELSPEVRLTEALQVTDGPLGALEYALGGVSLLVGDSRGLVTAWFRVRERDDDPEPRFVRAHVYPAQGAAITALAASARDKSFVSAGADGSLVLRHLTSERTLLSFAGGGQAVEAALLTPKADGLLARQADGRLASFDIANPHPDVSLRALLGRVWYEGYARPEYVWQSSGGTDDFETKFSLVPLVFGTFKGTLYALLFAVPVAVLAALYTSQFVHPTIKAKVKPTIEIMAALPSVVVGFVAGLWLAARVERAVVPVLLMLVLLPLCGTAGFALWSWLPERLSRRLRPGMELGLIVPLLLGAAGLALLLGPTLEGALFQGDFRLWLKSALGVVYDQRNCLVVGLAMGFAVIPIVFTISEDAFSSVPAHLSAASLALGASRWQTALRVVLPTASPGVFSAVMIGFGRAVGETMIVLMATGNTPVLEWSPFNGMRTLSANIAVEIPEAPHGGTLYRTLFLAALLLFVLTFAVNTLAEVVRQRLRERYKAI